MYNVNGSKSLPYGGISVEITVTPQMRFLAELHGHPPPHCETGDKVAHLSERQLAIRMLKQQPISLSIYHQHRAVPCRPFHCGAGRI
jgi:hypothetical protein